MAIPFFVSKLAISLMSPLGTALAVAVVGLLLLARWRRLAVTLLVLALAWLYFWSTPAASEWLQQRAEAGFPPQQAETMPVADAIVVLGGGIAPADAGHPYPDMNNAADRVWHAARLFRAGRAPMVFVTGGSDPDVSRMSEAQAMRGLLLDLGVPPARIVMEQKSRTTGENARFTAPMLKAYRVQRVLLVTSALHMRRAVGEFERAGVNVIPAATDHMQGTTAGARRWLPDTGALDAAGRTMKEFVGRAVLR